jgi:hypothetical protein
MPQVLVAGATIKCTHQGVAPFPSGDSRLVVSGNGAITAGMEVGITLIGCTFPSSTPGALPCVSQVATGGMSTLLAVGGTPVLLDNATGLTSNAVNWTVADPGQQLLSLDG